MELSLSYILSQVFSILSYVLIGATYYVKNRKTILVLSLFQALLLGVGYYFLHQYQGMLILTVSIITSIIIFIDEQKNGKSEKIEKKDIIILVCILIYTIILAIITYTEPLSLLSVGATILWVFSVWAKKVKTYKFLAIITCIFWLGFNIYAKSISGIIVEVILLITSILGYVLEIKRNNRKEK